MSYSYEEGRCYFKSKNRVNKSWNCIYDTGLEKTKTESSIRTIKVNDALLNHLKRLHALQLLQLSAKIENPDRLVFLNNRGRIPSPGACDVLLKKYHEKLGIKRISFHVLRHTHASYLLYQGVKMEYISKRLGHKNTAITRSVYTHLIKEDQEKETDLTLKALTKII